MVDMSDGGPTGMEGRTPGAKGGLMREESPAEQWTQVAGGMGEEGQTDGDNGRSAKEMRAQTAERRRSQAEGTRESKTTGNPRKKCEPGSKEKELKEAAGERCRQRVREGSVGTAH